MILIGYSHRKIVTFRAYSSVAIRSKFRVNNHVILYLANKTKNMVSSHLIFEFFWLDGCYGLSLGLSISNSKHAFNIKPNCWASRVRMMWARSPASPSLHQAFVFLVGQILSFVCFLLFNRHSIAPSHFPKFPSCDRLSHGKNFETEAEKAQELLARTRWRNQFLNAMPSRLLTVPYEFSVKDSFLISRQTVAI